MEITEINIIRDFEAGMKCLQNPSLISPFFSLPGVEKVPQLYSFWKWGALIIAIIATFSSIINRIKIIFVRFRAVKSLGCSSKPLLNDDSDYSDDDDDDDATSSDDEDDGFESTTSFEDREPVDEDFRVAASSCYGEDEWQNGNSKLTRRRVGGRCFSWSDFSAGESVVKLWDSFGSDISIWDLAKCQKISSFSGGKCQIPAVAMSSPSVVLSAAVNNGGTVVLGAYDLRVGAQIPSIIADWKPRRGTVVGISSGGVEKVYVRDSVSGAVTVGDMRNVKAPLENLTESDGDIWWDADAVIVQDEF